MTRDAPRPRGDDDPEETDAAFEAIVSSLQQPEPTSQQSLWPEAEDIDESSPPKADAPSVEPLGSTWQGWEDVAVPQPDEDEEPAEDEGHYVPPVPPPVPRGDRIVLWGWAGAVGAPVLALVLALFNWDLSGLSGIALVGMFLAGFVTLISRLRNGPADTDDGAVV